MDYRVLVASLLRSPGLERHKSKTQICIDEGGKEPVELRVERHPESFRRVFGPRERCRMLLEASTESEWVARCLEELGHEVIVAVMRVGWERTAQLTAAAT